MSSSITTMQARARIVTQRDDLPSRLDDLARRVAQLSPCRHNPERYHVEKSEIAFELRTLARSTPR
jgi:hypothetical protein